jgi:hypothetical protein
MESVRRKWLIVGGVVVVIFGAVAFASVDRGPYAFLEGFHPRHVEVDLAKIFGPGPVSPSLTPLPKLRILVFKPADHDAVLKAMFAHLTAKRGYTVTDSNNGGERHVSFAAPGAHGGFGVGAYFSYGPKTTTDTEWAESAKTGVPGATPPNTPPGCAVAIARDETWFDRQLGVVRRFLHL